MKVILQIESKLLHNQEFDKISDNLLNIKLCGNSILSNYLDLFQELEVSEIFVFSNELKNEISSYYLSELYSPKIIFMEWFEAEEFYLKKKEIFKDEYLLIIKNIGSFLNSFDDIKKCLLKEDNFLVTDNSFSVHFIKDHYSSEDIKKQSDLIEIKEIKTLKDYIYVTDKKINNIDDLNSSIGYESEDGIILGKNVKINKGVKLISPLLILDNVHIHKNCTIGPNVLVQNDIFIENDTNISNSIVFDNTYIGPNLSFDNKLIIEDTIINKITLENYSIDNKLTSKNN